MHFNTPRCRGIDFGLYWSLQQRSVFSLLFRLKREVLKTHVCNTRSHSARHFQPFSKRSSGITWSYFKISRIMAALQLFSGRGVFARRTGVYYGFSVTTTLSFIQKKIIDLAERVWLEDLHRPVRNSESGGKLCNYKLIKNCADTAGFVLAPLGPCQRWAVASLHAGCLPLAVETGRYRIPEVPLGERVCKLCNNGKVETEFHFVMECNKLQTLRNELFFIITEKDHTFIQFIYFFFTFTYTLT